MCVHNAMVAESGEIKGGKESSVHCQQICCYILQGENSFTLNQSKKGKDRRSVFEKKSVKFMPKVCKSPWD